jgi:DNA-directed RNA polymerase subunit omega
MVKVKSTPTVIDTDKCVEMIGNRFNLVLVAAQRVRELRRGSRPLVANDNNSTSHVQALKEIEAGKVGIEYLKKIR